MATMEALLKIKADVQGEGAIQGLAKNLGTLQDKAGKVQGGIKGLAGAAGGLAGGLQTLLPLASGAGMVALAKGAIDAADNMNDLRQKTGVSVEALSQFKQAAEKSGTTIESVGGAMVKLNRGLVNGNAAEALQSMGISANDATGKLKSTEQIMLEVSKRFAAMPDGAQKSALAMQLFGKSGADLIPMLNMGDKAIKSLAVTMTGEFASKADEFNDKMVDLQTGVTKLAVGLGTALMPFLTKVTDGLVGLVNGFNQLPGPIQNLIGLGAGILIAWGPVTGIFTTIVTILTTIGPLIAGLGPLIAGWAGIVGPAIAGITAAFSALLTWMTGTLLPGLLAVFTGPVGWTVLAVAAVVAMCVYFRKPIMDFFAWLGGAVTQGLNALWRWGEPIRRFWSGLWQGIATGFSTYVMGPISKGWNALAALLPSTMQKAADYVQGVWVSLVNGVKGVIRGLLQMVANAINSVGTQVNRLIGAFNRLPGPDIPFVPSLSVPAFAAGGVVGRPTLAMVGEGGEREYIVPESKMAAASSRFLAGARGAAVISSGSGTAGGRSPVINITTGPVIEFDGNRYVSVDDLERAMRVTAEGVIGRLRTPAARIALGMV